MSENKRSFWGSVPGLITGIAGLLTGVVGLVTLGVQQGIIGEDADSPATTVPGPAGGAGATPTTEAGAFTVSPTRLKLQPTERETEVTVRNSTRTAAITVRAPEFGGTDRSMFRADAGCTNVRLDPGRSCTLKVLFTPGGPLRTYSANLVVKADGVTASTEVPIEARAII